MTSEYPVCGALFVQHDVKMDLGAQKNTKNKKKKRISEVSCCENQMVCQLLEYESSEKQNVA